VHFLFRLDEAPQNSITKTELSTSHYLFSPLLDDEISFFKNAFAYNSSLSELSQTIITLKV